MYTRLITFLAFLGLSQAQLWPHFYTTYGIPFVTGLHTQPQVQNLAEALGWTKYGSCNDSSPFIGNRFGHGIDKDDLSVIFDVNGFVAGMQSIVPKFRADDSPYDFDADPMYILGDFYGEEVYYATVYFVDVEIICTTGRTREEYDLQGTGYTLLFQTGMDPSKDLLKAPLTEDKAIADPMWFGHKCHDNMGNNYFSHPAGDLSADCNTLFPVKLMFDKDRQLNAFSWQHQANMQSGFNWEQPSKDLLNSVYDPSAPTCILDLVDQQQFTTMHIFLNTYSLKCDTNVE